MDFPWLPFSSYNYTTTASPAGETTGAASSFCFSIGWDGGINADNVVELVRAGVEVLNVGGFIQHSSDPGAAYAKLEAVTNSKK